MLESPGPSLMTMSNSHRGLPPMLPNPNPASSMGNLPAPPNQWQGADESMRNWLQAKAEEDRRRQEEERTKQEGLKLEQRRIEHLILRDSLGGGVPPQMVPIVFAGMAGGTLASSSLEWAQYYLSQITLTQQQQSQQQQQALVQAQAPPHPQPPQMQALPPAQSSPELQRQRSMTGPQPNPYANHQPPPPPAATVVQAHNQQQAFGSPYQVNNDRRYQQPPPAAVTSAPRQSALSRLNTGEIQIQPPVPGGAVHQGQPQQHTHQQSVQTQEQQQTSSPAIYFHHWVPPNTNKDPPTPAKSQHTSPYASHPLSHLRSEYQNSPKKRKTNLESNESGEKHGKSPHNSPHLSQVLPMGGRQRAYSQRSEGFHRNNGNGQNVSSSHENGDYHERQQSTSDSGSQRHSSARPDSPNSRGSHGDRKRTLNGDSKLDSTAIPSLRQRLLQDD